MDRFFVRTAFIVVCAAWTTACGGPSADVAKPAALPANDAAASNQPVTIEGEIASAHALRVKGDYDSAAKVLGQLMLVAPDNPAVVGEYGKTLLEQGRPGDSLPFLKRALELKAADWTVYSAMGVAYDQINDHAHARLAYERALALKPGSPQVLNNYAMSRMLSGDIDGARRLMAQASSSADPKIAANIALLATMKRPVKVMAQPAPTPLAEAASPHKVTASPTRVAVTTPPAASKPSVAVATTEPASSVSKPVALKPTATNSETPVANGAPRVIANVEMQKMPTTSSDVRHKTTNTAAETSKGDQRKSTKVAQTPAQPKSSDVPMLRTAADGQ